MENVAITTELLEPVIDAIIANIAVIVPVGVTLFGIMLGLALVPRVLKKFTSA